MGQRRGSVRRRLFSFGALMLTQLVLGCGRGGDISQMSSPLIVQQPADATAPLGSSVSFTVVAEGLGPLAYRWFRNGSAISAASGSSYSISPVSASDDGSSFSVEISNRFGQTTSRSADLKIGARLPDPLDLRFQQVGSPSTYNGYRGYASPIGNLLPKGALGFSGVIGTPLSIGPGCPAGLGSIYNCAWVDSTFSQPTGVVQIDTHYQSSAFSDWPGVLAQVEDVHTVVTGLDLAPSFDSAAFSWAVSHDSSSYQRHTNISTVASLGPSVAVEANAGRVTTAVSFNNGQVNFLSYGWSNDTSNHYETSVVLTTKQQVVSAAQMLAKSGYIITAGGGNDTDGVLLVGTKVKGDSIERPLLVVSGGARADALLSQGYAVVLVVLDQSGYIAIVGER